MAEILVSLPDALLNAIDAEAAHRSMSRDELLALLTWGELAQHPNTATASALTPQALPVPTTDFAATPLVW